MISRRTFLSALLSLGAAAAGRGPVIAGAAALPAEPWAERLVAAARGQVGVTLFYDPRYQSIAYPGGDVPRSLGVCTDVIVRAYRDGLGLDLQKLVHEDMKRAFSAYPKKWGSKSTDWNIDHRRVPNLQTFFQRKGSELPVSTDAGDYRPGDIVTQTVAGNLPHIVIVSNEMNPDATRPLVIHNIGMGAQIEDTLFAFPITGHYRYPG